MKNAIVVSHHPTLWRLALESRDRTVEFAKNNPSRLATDAVTTLLLAVATAEGFINELCELMAMKRDGDREIARALPNIKNRRAISPELAALADILQEVERSRGSLELKFLMAGYTLSGKIFDRGDQSFADFTTLIRLRNDVMHLKPRDSLDQSSSDLSPPGYIKGLQQRKLVIDPPESDMSWFTMLQCAPLAVWACDTVLRMITTILEMVPDPVEVDGYFPRDPVGAMKYGFGLREFGFDSSPEIRAIHKQHMTDAQQ